MSNLLGSFGMNYVRPNGLEFAFIDADNVRIGLSQSLMRRGVPVSQVGVFDLKNLFRSTASDRYYVFGAVEKKGEPQEWLISLRSSPNFIFKEGVLTVNGTKRKQQGVDVLIAVEALRCAQQRTMNSCVIFSGDGDLLPLVKALVDMGIFTTIVSFDDPEKSNVASDLRDASDNYIHVGSRILANCIGQNDGRLTSQNLTVSHIRLLGPVSELQVADTVYNAVIHPDGKATLIMNQFPMSQYGEATELPTIRFASVAGLTVYLTLVGSQLV